MADQEKGITTATKVDNPSEEAAAAKLWAVYISEAEKYNKALVESWKSDMEGMLIFAGLFSASSTAFLIESYKTLNPESRDTTVRLLSQISQQLATPANGSTFPMDSPTPFTPTAASLVCNALWFISLGFSLTCTLITTLLEQWARDFLHKTEIRSAPVLWVEEIIPLLLHASLLFFFAGLVAFLIPVNLTMSVIASVILSIVAAINSVLTLFPLCHTDSPYRTPLSGPFWGLSQSFQRLWRRRHVDGTPAIEAHALPGDSMVGAVVRTATASSDERSARDRRALIWAMKPLADDNELEPFVEAIPGVLWGPKVRWHAYNDHIRRLITHPDVQLFSRVEGLLRSCNTGLLPLEASKRRSIVTRRSGLWRVWSIFSHAGNVQLFLIRQGNYILKDILHYTEPPSCTTMLSRYSSTQHQQQRQSSFGLGDVLCVDSDYRAVPGGSQIS
ncbi:hypothetical protein DFH09DRAFT_1070176 [Mycena vulgaris]|nr:hypothetical protein DFH09DRAFT_1070176 [Mycena vulgaris]